MNIDIIIVICYFILVIGCGFVGMLFTKNHEDFLVAGRTLPLWMYFPCLSTVLIGGGATFGSVTLSYQSGISGAWITIMYGLGIMTMGFLLSSSMAKLRIFSISEMLEMRYSVHARYLSAIISTAYTFMLSVVQVIAIGSVLNAFLGWDLQTAMIIGGCISLSYTLLGGMRSIAFTDLVQFCIMVIGIFVLMVPATLVNIGTFGEVQAQIPEGFLNPVGIGLEKVFMYFLLMFLGIMIGQDVWQRVFTAGTPEIAAKGTKLAGIFSLFWGGAMALFGIGAYILLPSIDPQLALGNLVVKLMPAGLQGIVIAALLSTLMSSCSGQTLATSTLIANDILKEKFFGDVPNKKMVLYIRITTFIIGVLSILAAICIGNVLEALDIAYALLSGCVFIPVVFGFFWKKATAKGAFASMLVSFIITSALIIFYGASSPITIVVGISTSIVVLIAVSLYCKDINEAQQQKWEDTLNQV